MAGRAADDDLDFVDFERLMEKVVSAPLYDFERGLPVFVAGDDYDRQQRVEFARRLENGQPLGDVRFDGRHAQVAENHVYRLGLEKLQSLPARIRLENAICFFQRPKKLLSHGLVIVDHEHGLFRFFRHKSNWRRADRRRFQIAGAQLFGLQRQNDFKFGSHIDSARHVDSPPMLLDDVAAGVKSEPDALLFGRGEGVEQSLAHELFGHPLPGVGDRDARRAVLLPGGYAEDAAVGHRLDRVDHQVFNHALDSLAVHQREQLGGQLGRDVILDGRLRRRALDDTVDQVRDVRPFAEALGRRAWVGKFRDQVLQVVDRIGERAHRVLLEPLTVELALHVVDQQRKRQYLVLEVMRQYRREPRERFELLLLALLADHFAQTVRHPVERLGQHAGLVLGLDLDLIGELAHGYRLGALRHATDRIGDLADQVVEREHRDDDQQHRQQQEHIAVELELPGPLAVIPYHQDRELRWRVLARMMRKDPLVALKAFAIPFAQRGEDVAHIGEGLVIHPALLRLVGGVKHYSSRTENDRRWRVPVRRFRDAWPSRRRQQLLGAQFDDQRGSHVIRRVAQRGDQFDVRTTHVLLNFRDEDLVHGGEEGAGRADDVFAREILVRIEGPERAVPFRGLELEERLAPAIDDDQS